MAKYQKYAEYKDSGIEWLGEIPSHWQASYVGVVSDVIDPQPDHRAPAISEDGEGFPYIGIRDVNKDGTLNFETARPVEESAVLKQERSFTIEPHNIIFCKVGTLGLPRNIIPHGRCALSATLVLIKARKIDSQFLLYALDSDCIISQTNFLATGSTRAALGIQQIRKFRIPFPPVIDQLAIANFLDHETAKIDSLIAKQEKLIELLKEKRQAVISHAVTKGLNPDVNMKDSGVEWLGQVPEHWTVSCIKYILAKEKDAMVDGPFGSSVNTATDYVEEGIPVIRTVNITNQGFSSDNLKFMRVSKFEELKRHSVKTGDVLFSKVGTIGNACIFPENMGVGILSTTGSCKISINEDLIDRDFLVFQIHCMNQELMQIANANVQPFLNMTNIKNLRISLPSLDEQQAIISLLKSKLDSFNRLIAKAESAIELMQERRTALISSAVTGKIDVRNWQHPNKNNEANTELGA